MLFFRNQIWMCSQNFCWKETLFDSKLEYLFCLKMTSCSHSFFNREKTGRKPTPETKQERLQQHSEWIYEKDTLWMMTGSEVKNKNIDNGKKDNATFLKASGIAIVHGKITIDVEKTRVKELIRSFFNFYSTPYTIPYQSPQLWESFLGNTIRWGNSSTALKEIIRKRSDIERII